jgi:hypothetical protein
MDISLGLEMLVMSGIADELIKRLDSDIKGWNFMENF